MGKEQRMNEANEASATLLRLAQQHANIYAPLPGVQAIVVTGSVAGGYADHYSDIDMLIYYDELPPNMEKSLLGVLFALNHIYNPNEWKRMDWWLGKLTIAPEQLSARLKSVLLSEPTPGLHAFGKLASETLDLVDAHMPQVDTKPVREELRYQQEAWTAFFR